MEPARLDLQPRPVGPWVPADGTDGTEDQRRVVSSSHRVALMYGSAAGAATAAGVVVENKSDL